MDQNERFFLLTARKLSGEASGEEWTELRQIMQENPELHARFEYLRSYWKRTNDVASDLESAYKKVKSQMHSEASPENLPTGRISKTPGSFRRLLLKGMAAAAMATGIIIMGYWLYNSGSHGRKNEIIAQQDLLIKQNPKGNTSVIYLSDSTRVVLNADSKLEFPEQFNGLVREVHLSGEAYFDVTHDDQKPFIIHAGRMNIKVLGTEFNVRSYPDDSTSEASLVRGMIEVTLSDRPSDKIILKPSEKLIVSNELISDQTPGQSDSPVTKEARLFIGKLNYLSPADSTAIETVWTDNRIVFKDESFFKLARDLERKYDVNIKFLDQRLRDLRFTGAFDKESLREILNALQMTEKFNYTIKKDSILIY